MKVFVYPRGANPRVDRPIQRKTLEFCRQQVEQYGSADWVDPKDHSKGIVCRQFLHFGARVAQKITAAGVDEARYMKRLKKRLRSALPPVEVGGCRFVAPGTEKNPTLARAILTPVTEAAWRWDWSKEAVSA